MGPTRRPSQELRFAEPDRGAESIIAARCISNDLIALTGRSQPPAEWVEFEAGHPIRNGAQQARDHRKIGWAVAGDVTGEIDFVLDRDIEQRGIVFQCRRWGVPHFRYHSTDFEQQPSLPITQSFQSSFADPRLPDRGLEFMVFVFELRPQFVQCRN